MYVDIKGDVLDLALESLEVLSPASEDWRLGCLEQLGQT